MLKSKVWETATSDVTTEIVDTVEIGIKEYRSDRPWIAIIEAAIEGRELELQLKNGCWEKLTCQWWSFDQILKSFDRIRIKPDAITKTGKFDLIERWNTDKKSDPLPASELLDWAESIICNAKPEEYFTQTDWDNAIRKWRDEKHRLFPDGNNGGVVNIKKEPSPANETTFTESDIQSDLSEQILKEYLNKQEEENIKLEDKIYDLELIIKELQDENTALEAEIERMRDL